MTYRTQNTICEPTSVQGISYWGGRTVNVEFCPAEPDTGIRFVRSDQPNEPIIHAAVANRTQSPRRTTLTRNGVSVEMVEHVMGALSGLQVDNCIVRVDDAELPGLDGSAKGYVDAILQAGIQPQSANRPQVHIDETIRIGDDESTWIQVEPADQFRLTYLLKYPNQPSIGTQSIDIDVTPDSFRTELAPARTFLLLQEADWLRDKGLGNHVTYQDLLVFGEEGPIENDLRFQNECARHKALDVVGDLALCEYDIVGHVTASRTGHRINGELVKRILAHGRIENQSASDVALRKAA